MDDVHVNFSHRDHLVNTSARPYVPTKTTAQETPFGITQFQERGEHTDRIHFIMPNQCFLAHPLRFSQEHVCVGLPQLLVGGLEQQPSVLHRERLGPPQIRDVGIELGGVRLEPRELRIFEVRSESFLKLPGDLCVQGR